MWQIYVYEGYVMLIFTQCYLKVLQYESTIFYFISYIIKKIIFVSKGIIDERRD